MLLCTSGEVRVKQVPGNFRRHLVYFACCPLRVFDVDRDESALMHANKCTNEKTPASGSHQFSALFRKKKDWCIAACSLKEARWEWGRLGCAVNVVELEG